MSLPETPSDTFITSATVVLDSNSSVFTSDGTTLWIQTSKDHRIAAAYNLFTLERQPQKDVDVDDFIQALWTDGTTMWARGVNYSTIVAYTIHDGAEQTARFIQTDESGGTEAKGLWSDGSTIWASDSYDNKIYAYRMPAASDTSIGVLTVNGEDVAGLHPDEIDHQHGVASSVTQATVLAKPTNRFAELVFDGTDADAETDGFQVNLAAGENTLAIIVNAPNDDGEGHTLSINRGVGADFGWRAVDDLDGVMTVAGNSRPTALWGNRTTFWVGDSSTARLYAYDRESKTRDPGKDFTGLQDAGNTAPWGIWSDGATMWVSDATDSKIYAYSMETKDRDSDKDFDTLYTAGNQTPYALWSDEVTMWVADTFDNKLYAYSMETKDPDSDRDFDSVNQFPRGLWSDGVTMWVSDWSENKIYAYDMETKAPDPDKNFNTLLVLQRRIWRTTLEASYQRVAKTPSFEYRSCLA